MTNWHEHRADAQSSCSSTASDQTPSRTDSRQLDAIDPFNIEHIEVISGATSLYGGGSTGGLINIVTKKGQQERQVDLELGGKTGFANSNDHEMNE